MLVLQKKAKCEELPQTGKKFTFSFECKVDDDNSKLYAWMAKVYELIEDKPREPSEYATEVFVTSKQNERFKLHSCWPSSINFGDLDFSNSEFITIEVTLTFTKLTYLQEN